MKRITVLTMVAMSLVAFAHPALAGTKDVRALVDLNAVDTPQKLADVMDGFTSMIAVDYEDGYCQISSQIRDVVHNEGEPVKVRLTWNASGNRCGSDNEEFEFLKGAITAPGVTFEDL